MEAIYLIETKDNHKLRWRFEEVQYQSDYGNGRYVIIVNLDTRQLIANVDIRHWTNFNFETFCRSYVEGYFKNNLENYFMED